MSYATVLGQQPMLFDLHRNELYAAAMAQSLRAEHAVLDLGAGLGVHGLRAAQLGARVVYMVEPQPVLGLAGEAAALNGLRDRLRLIQGRIEDVDLPEPVDMIVSVMTGNLLFSEDLLPSLYHARDKYLKRGGTMVPRLGRLRAQLVHAPEWRARTWGRWADPMLGLDYSCGMRHAANEIQWWDRRVPVEFRPLAAPMTLVELDFSRTQESHCAARLSCRVVEGQECNGVLVWIELDLGGRILSTHPHEPAVHWTPGLLPIEPGLPVQAGEDVEVELHRPRGGDWTWRVAAIGGRRRHSTFLGRVDGPRDWVGAAPGAHPRLSARGERALAVLEIWRRGGSNADALALLTTQHAMGDSDARAFLNQLVGEWSSVAMSKPEGSGGA